MYKKNNSTLIWSIVLCILAAVLCFGLIAGLAPNDSDDTDKDKDGIFDNIFGDNDDTVKPDDTTKPGTNTPVVPDEGGVSGGDSTCSHKWDDGVVVKAAACNATGIMRYTCTLCDATTENDIAATGAHTYVSYSKISDTHHKSVCSTCGGAPITESHDWTTSTISATCTTAGKITYECKKCHSQDIQDIEAYDHTVNSWVSSTSNAGQHVGICVTCNAPVTKEHSFTAWVVTVAAKCDQVGKEQRSCEGCGKLETRDIKATGHKWGDPYVTKAATCTEAGSQHRICDVCYATEAPQVIPALGHNLEVKDLNASEHVFDCSRCDYSYTAVHSKSSATAEECERCGHPLVDCEGNIELCYDLNKDGMCDSCTGDMIRE